MDHDGAGTSRSEFATVRSLILGCGGRIGLGRRGGSNKPLVGLLLDLYDVGGLCLGGVLCTVLEVELLRQLEIQLDGGALVLTLECIGDGYVNLGAVESTVTRVELPRRGALGSVAELVECGSETGLGVVPGGHIAKMALGASGQLHLEGEAKVAVDGLEEVKERGHFGANLEAESA